MSWASNVWDNPKDAKWSEPSKRWLVRRVLSTDQVLLLVKSDFLCRLIVHWIGLREIYRNPPYFMVKTLVSCRHYRFSMIFPWNQSIECYGVHMSARLLKFSQAPRTLRLWVAPAGSSWREMPHFCRSEIRKNDMTLIGRISLWLCQNSYWKWPWFTHEKWWIFP